MNKKLALLAVPMIMFAAPRVAAINQWGHTPYLGADIQWRHMNFRKGYGDNLFRHDYQQGNVYTGIRLCEVVGLEVGYESTNKMSHPTLLKTGELSAGIPVGDPVEYSSSAHIKGPHINFVGFIPLSEKYRLKLIGLVGIARLKFSLIRHANLIYIGGLGVTPISAGVSPDTTFTKKQSVLRLGVGFEHKFSRDWGIRGMVIWENTDKFKITSKELPPSSVNVKNSVIYSLGGFVTF